MSMMLQTAGDLAAQLGLQAPDPGNGAAPPGTQQNFTTILQWVTWLALAVCVGGVIVSGAAMAVAHRHGGGAEHGARLAWVLAGCVVIGVASGLVNALI